MSFVFRGASPRRTPLHVAWMAGTPAPRQAHFAPLALRSSLRSVRALAAMLIPLRLGRRSAKREGGSCGSLAALVRTLRIWVTTASTVVIGGSSTVLACPVCFGAEETSMVDGTKLGVLVMLAITLAVQGAFVGFFLYLRRRAKAVADIELDTEWSELQRSPRTS
jgi:hypothetical protein